MLSSKDEIAALNADNDFMRLMEESWLTVMLTVSKVQFPLVPEIQYNTIQYNTLLTLPKGAFQ